MAEPSTALVRVVEDESGGLKIEDAASGGEEKYGSGEKYTRRVGEIQYG